MPNKVPQPDQFQDPFATQGNVEVAQGADLADIFGDASPEQLDPSGPGLMQRIKDRFASETQDVPISPEIDAFEPAHSEDLWGDSFAVIETERPGLLERVRSHRKVVAAVTALALLGGGAGSVVAAEQAIFGDEAAVVQEHTPQQRQQDKQEVAQKGGIDTALETELESSLKVLDTPIRPQDVIDRELRGESFPTDIKEGEIPETIKKYNPEFFGAVRTEHGLSFNIYGATQPGQEKSLDSEFKINPAAIEFMVDEIINNIPSSPDNPAKQTILSNLQKFQTGEQERIIDMVVDVSESGGCLNAEQQLITYAQELCAAGGVALRDVQSADRVPIVISSGLEDKAAIVTTEQAHVVGEIPTEEELERFRQEAEELQEEYDRNPKPSLSEREAMILHEMGHAVSDDRVDEPVNTYHEGDHDHETVDWLLGDRLDEYDLQGAGPSPMLRQKISEMLQSGDLRPVVERVKG